MIGICVNATRITTSLRVQIDANTEVRYQPSLWSWSVH